MTIFFLLIYTLRVTYIFLIAKTVAVVVLTSM